MVTLSKHGISYTRTVHKLVAEAFLGKREKDKVVRHLDGNAKNNLVENLAYGTQKENMADALRHNTICYGEKRSKNLTNDMVAEIKRLHKAGVKNSELVRMFNSSDCQISEIVNGARWVHVGEYIERKRKVKLLTETEKQEVMRMGSV